MSAEPRLRVVDPLCTCGHKYTEHLMVAGQGYVGPCTSSDPSDTCVAFDADASQPKGELVLNPWFYWGPIAVGFAVGLFIDNPLPALGGFAVTGVYTFLHVRRQG